MKTPQSLAYIDTNILLAIIGHDAPDQKYRQAINKILYKHKIKIPQIVLGEALAIIVANNPTQGRISQYVRDIESISRKINLDLDGFPPTSNEIIKKAKQLADLSDVINDMDSLILAHAIVDCDATHFFTTDRDLKNTRIMDHVKDLKRMGVRNRILNIPTDFAIDRGLLGNDKRNR